MLISRCVAANRGETGQLEKTFVRRQRSLHAAHWVTLMERDTRIALRQVPIVRGLPNCEQALFAFWRIEIRGGIVPTNTEGREAIVPEAAGRRLSNQVTRAYRGTYGARAGLRTLVRAMSVQLLRAGASAASALPALVSEYSSEVAIELGRQRTPRAP
jgi:hypothetical protein